MGRDFSRCKFGGIALSWLSMMFMARLFINGATARAFTPFERERETEIWGRSPRLSHARSSHWSLFAKNRKMHSRKCGAALSLSLSLSLSSLNILLFFLNQLIATFIRSKQWWAAAHWGRPSRPSGGSSAVDSPRGEIKLPSYNLGDRRLGKERNVQPVRCRDKVTSASSTQLCMMFISAKNQRTSEATVSLRQLQALCRVYHDFPEDLSTPKVQWSNPRVWPLI